MSCTPGFSNSIVSHFIFSFLMVHGFLFAFMPQDFFSKAIMFSIQYAVSVLNCSFINYLVMLELVGFASKKFKEFLFCFSVCDLVGHGCGLFDFPLYIANFKYLDFLEFHLASPWGLRWVFHAQFSKCLTPDI